MRTSSNRPTRETTVALWLGHARATVLVSSGLAVILVERALAPRAWEAVSWAQSYSEAYVERGYWTPLEALISMAPIILLNLGVPCLLAVIPFLVGWLLDRRWGPFKSG